MKAKVFISFLIFFSLSLKAFSQYVQEWVARYNSSNNYYDGATNLAVDGEGNVYVTGESDRKYLTIKYNSSGRQLWIAGYNGPFLISSSRPSSIAVDNSNNIYITGESNVSDPHYKDYATLKYSLNGNQLWVNAFNSPFDNHDRASTMVLDGSNNLIVTGFSISPCANGDFAWNTIKYSSNGNPIWQASYCEINNSVLTGYAPSPALAIDSSGNVIIAGNSIDTSNISDQKFSIIKYNQSGQQLWVKNLQSHSDECAIAADKSGNIYFAGASEGGLIIIKYELNGDTLWVRRYNGLSLTNIAIDKSKNIYVAGTGFPNDFVTIKYDSNGTLAWAAIDTVGTRMYSMTIDYSENVYATGYTGTHSASDFYTAKYSASGSKLWSSQYNGSANASDIANGIGVNEFGDIFVTGSSTGLGTGSDYTTIKYSILTNSNNNFSEVVSFNLHQNYPNPFNPVTHLEFGISDLEFVSLKVYNYLGKEVKTLVNEIRPAGSYAVDFDGTNLPSGVYYYKLEAGSFSEVRKMVLLK